MKYKLTIEEQRALNKKIREGDNLMAERHKEWRKRFSIDKESNDPNWKRYVKRMLRLRAKYEHRERQLATHTYLKEILAKRPKKIILDARGTKPSNSMR